MRNPPISKTKTNGFERNRTHLLPHEINGLDSVELTMEIEDEFEITVPESEVETVRTIGIAFRCIVGFGM